MYDFANQVCDLILAVGLEMLPGRYCGKLIAGTLVSSNLTAGTLVSGNLSADTIVSGYLTAGILVSGNLTAGTLLPGYLTAGIAYLPAKKYTRAGYLPVQVYLSAQLFALGFIAGSYICRRKNCAGRLAASIGRLCRQFLCLHAWSIV